MFMNLPLVIILCGSHKQTTINPETSTKPFPYKAHRTCFPYINYVTLFPLPPQPPR